MKQSGTTVARYLFGELMPEKVLNEAISFCSRKSGRTRNEILNCLIKGEVWTHGTFRYALAKALCNYLTATNVTIKAVYILGSRVKDTSSFTSDFDLVF